VPSQSVTPLPSASSTAPARAGDHRRRRAHDAQQQTIAEPIAEEQARASSSPIGHVYTGPYAKPPFGALPRKRHWRKLHYGNADALLPAGI